MSVRRSPKVTVYLGAELAEELRAEVTRLGASPSRLMRYAWGLTCDQIRRVRQASELEAMETES